MDKNIFVKKYNPDIASKFSNKKLEDSQYTKDSIEYKKELWKGITGKDFLNNVTKPEDFVINFENPDFEAIRTSHNTEYYLRQNEIKEIEEKKKKIKEAAMQNVMKIQLDLGIQIKPIETKSHDELKHLQINEQDLLKEEKFKFNELLKGLEGII
jgi:hypothetical protein